MVRVPAPYWILTSCISRSQTWRDVVIVRQVCASAAGSGEHPATRVAIRSVWAIRALDIVAPFECVVDEDVVGIEDPGWSRDEGASRTCSGEDHGAEADEPRDPDRHPGEELQHRAEEPQEA